MTTVIYDKTSILTGTDDGGGDGLDGNRVVITSLGAGVGGETQFRVTIRWGTACPTETGSLSDMFGGRGAAAGNTYNFANTPTRVTFSGAHSANGSAAGIVVSDWVALPETYDNTKPFVVSWLIKSGSTSSSSVATTTATELWFAVGSDPSLQTTTGLTDQGAQAYLVEKIEIQGTTAGLTAKSVSVLQAVKCASYW